MGHTACTEAQCLYKGALYRFYCYIYAVYIHVLHYYCLTDINTEIKEVIFNSGIYKLRVKIKKWWSSVVRIVTKLWAGWSGV
jgi:hypothetical protein